MRADFVQCRTVFPDLHSFPTRRSSDLVAVVLVTPAAVAAQPRDTPARATPQPQPTPPPTPETPAAIPDRKSTRLNSSHSQISYAVFCLKKKTATIQKVVTPEHHAGRTR